MDGTSVAPGVARDNREEALQELPAAAEAAARYLRRKEAHCPPELLDGHEGRYGRRLERAIGACNG